MKVNVPRKYRAVVSGIYDCVTELRWDDALTLLSELPLEYAAAQIWYQPRLCKWSEDGGGGAPRVTGEDQPGEDQPGDAQRRTPSSQRFLFTPPYSPPPPPDKERIGQTCLHWVCKKGAPVSLVSRLLELAEAASEWGASILLGTATPYAVLPIHLAAMNHNSVEVFKELVKYHPKGLVTFTQDARDPLSGARAFPNARTNHDEIVEFLRDATAAVRAEPPDFVWLASLCGGEVKAIRKQWMGKERLKVRVEVLMCLKVLWGRKPGEEGEEGGGEGLDVAVPRGEISALDAAEALNEDVWAHIVKML